MSKYRFFKGKVLEYKQKNNNFAVKVSVYFF